MQLIKNASYLNINIYKPDCIYYGRSFRISQVSHQEKKYNMYVNGTFHSQFIFLLICFIIEFLFEAFESFIMFKKLLYFI